MKKPNATRAISAAVLLAAGIPAFGFAQTPPDQSVILPTPAPLPSSGGTPIPYPAYGTPAPDVAHLTQKPGVPTSVSLQQSIKIAVALSPVFATANAQWAIIHARYTSSKQALLPGLSGTAQIGNAYSTQGFGINGPGGGVLPTTSPIPTTQPTGITNSGTSGRTTSESATINLQQLIFDGGRTIANIRSAKFADYAGRATLVRDLQTLAFNVASAYYLVLQDNATVVADNQLVKEFEVNEAAVVAQIKNGAAARSDLAAAQFQTAQSRGNLVTAQGAAIAAQAAFATTLGLDADAEAVPKSLTSQPAEPNPTYAKSLTRAFILRPDYLSADYTVTSDQANVRYAKLARSPVLTGAASYGTSRILSSPYSNVYNTSQFSNDKSIGLTLAVPIYDQGVTNYNVAVAAATLDTAIAGLNQERLQVESDVRSALANLISARSLLVQTNSELTAARVSLDATQAQYRVGATTIINVVTAEANLATAQSDQIHAVYNVQNAQQNYLYATGETDLQL
ncbi:MAG TPA: TolC family protein [Candidatus Tumulicola sp.]|jgi:outer membrane protein TolC